MAVIVDNNLCLTPEVGFAPGATNVIRIGVPTDGVNTPAAGDIVLMAVLLDEDGRVDLPWVDGPLVDLPGWATVTTMATSVGPGARLAILVRECDGNESPVELPVRRFGGDNGLAETAAIVVWFSAGTRVTTRGFIEEVDDMVDIDPPAEAVLMSFVAAADAAAPAPTPPAGWVTPPVRASTAAQALYCTHLAVTGGPQPWAWTNLPASTYARVVFALPRLRLAARHATVGVWAGGGAVLTPSIDPGATPLDIDQFAVDPSPTAPSPQFGADAPTEPWLPDGQHRAR